jgi:hypothetical protein
LELLGGWLDARSFSISSSMLDPAILGEKIQKLLNQQLLFLRDDLGDPSRSDTLWTLGHIHIVWIGLALVGCFGLSRSFVERTGPDVLFGSILLVTYAVSLSISFPEGRYLVTSLPCLVYFILRGLRATAAYRVNRTWILSIVLLAMTANTAYLLVGPYNDDMLEVSSDQAGLEEAVGFLRSGSAGESPILAIDPLNDQTLLAFQLYSNFEFECMSPQAVIQMLASPGDPSNASALSRVHILLSSNDPGLLDLLTELEFRAVHHFEERDTARPFVILAR